MVRKALILPAAACGSLGDEAALLGLARGFDQFEVFARHANDWPNFPPIRTADACADKSHFLTIGADVFDGSFGVGCTREIVAMHQRAAEREVPVRAVVGFSFRPNVSREVLDEIARMPAGVKFVPRDPLSFDAFTKQTGRGAEVLRGADPAFLMQPAGFQKHTRAVEGWAGAHRAAGRRIVGLNLSGLLYSKRRDIFAALEKCVYDARNECAFLLLPHDFRGEASDMRPLFELWYSNPGHTLIARDAGAADVKALCGLLDFVVTGRMHVAIAALGMGVPAAVIDYNHKVRGLLSMFGHEELAIDSAASATAAFDSLQKNVVPLIGQVRAALPRVMNLARLAWL